MCLLCFCCWHQQFLILITDKLWITIHHLYYMNVLVYKNYGCTSRYWWWLHVASGKYGRGWNERHNSSVLIFKWHSWGWGGGGTECYSQRFPAFPLPYSQNLLKYFSSGLEYIKVCNWKTYPFINFSWLCSEWHPFNSSTLHECTSSISLTWKVTFTQLYSRSIVNPDILTTLMSG